MKRTLILSSALALSITRFPATIPSYLIAATNKNEKSKKPSKQVIQKQLRIFSFEQTFE